MRDTGKTRAEAETDIDDVTAVFEFYAEEGAKFDEPKHVKGKGIPDSVESQIVKEPVGVCVLIAPWNCEYAGPLRGSPLANEKDEDLKLNFVAPSSRSSDPLLQICWKLGPALVAGNSCIVKPSEVTPLSTIFLHKLMLEAGVPPQAIQLLTAGGQSVGPTLTEHKDVDLVSFTGGLATGRSIIRSCAETVKRCCVELGGKNPNVIFSDVPLDIAVDMALTAVFVHSGQVCSSGARLIIEDKGTFADDVVRGVVDRAQKIVLGNGLDEGVECGPLVSAAHLAKVKSFVEMGKSEGAQLLCGGKPPGASTLAKGYFFEPTVFDRCDRSMRIVQSETFGPILTVERFAPEDEDTAVMLANDTTYGLAGGVQTADAARSRRVAKRLRHGTVWRNTFGAYTPRAEWGGFGMSGNGRELGSAGLDEYVETKHIYAEKTLAPMGWFTGVKARL